MVIITIDIYTHTPRIAYRQLSETLHIVFISTSFRAGVVQSVVLGEVLE